MDELTLLRIGRADTAFLQYIPGNMRGLLAQEGTVCVGAVFRGVACGAALAEETEPGGYHLRYIFVDPAARLCGLGTYLLRGLLGELANMGAERVTAVYAPSMLESGGQTLSILQGAGFSAPRPAATAFSVPLGEMYLPEVSLPEGMVVYTAVELPDELADAYEELALSGELPAFADVTTLESPSAGVSTFCAVDGTLSGVLLVERKPAELAVAGLYVLEGYRRGRTAAALISRSIREARRLCPPETEVSASAINRDSFALCDKLFRRKGARGKETEFVSAFEFGKDGEI